jgi:hypothetical protein
MKYKALVLTPLVCLLATSAAAQTATGVGVGTGVANSRSKSGAVAISGQGGAAQATGNGNSSLTITGAAVPAATSSVATTHADITEKNVPTAFAPGLAAAGLETCLGSVSGGGSFVGTGFSFGSTIPDPGCAARLDARTLWSMGLKKAAIARLCLTGEIYRSMPDICATYVPQVQTYGTVYGAYGSTAATTNVAYAPSSGIIEVTEGKTGRVRPCSDYDGAMQKCRMWADTGMRTRVAVHKPKPRPLAATQVASKPAETTVSTEPKKEN